MATYDLEEQEQLDELKTWWKMYGNLVTAVAVAVALAAVSWQGWNWWQRKQSAEASTLYFVVQQAVGQKDAKRAREAAGELIDKYAGTAYAGMAALLSAKAQIEAGDGKTARAQMTWAADNAKDEALRELARLRLAAVLLDEKAYDEAAKQLAAEPGLALAPRHAELKGDLFALQGKMAEAKQSYEAALVKVDAAAKLDGNPHAAFRGVLQAKIESLGSAK
ncbi:MAG: tetratricopeptide repeat protein [Sterolibacteriaceae bacterium MAG5]|nr:tetratricopeptide repeat protein [Candidatus Nitricoxidireducens bremensis]